MPLAMKLIAAITIPIQAITITMIATTTDGRTRGLGFGG